MAIWPDVQIQFAKANLAGLRFCYHHSGYQVPARKTIMDVEKCPRCLLLLAAYRLLLGCGDSRMLAPCSARRRGRRLRFG